MAANGKGSAQRDSAQRDNVPGEIDGKMGTSRALRYGAKSNAHALSPLCTRLPTLIGRDPTKAYLN
jgi:hypothetical protein